MNYYMESLGGNISALTVTSVFYKSSLTPLLRLNKEVTYCPDHLLRFHPKNAPSSSPDTGGNSWFCQDCPGWHSGSHWTLAWSLHHCKSQSCCWQHNHRPVSILLPPYLQLPGKIRTLDRQDFKKYHSTERNLHTSPSNIQCCSDQGRVTPWS